MLLRVCVGVNIYQQLLPERADAYNFNSFISRLIHFSNKVVKTKILRIKKMVSVEQISQPTNLDY